MWSGCVCDMSEAKPQTAAECVLAIVAPRGGTMHAALD